MVSIPAKQTEDFSLPALGLGTWQMGGRYERDPNNDDERDVDAIRYAIRSGIRHIDTAEIYAAGHAEEIVAQAIKGTPREELFITTKVSDEHLRYDDILRACEGSLNRLGAAYIDLYLVHAPNPAIPLQETVRAMDALVESKLIRFIGVSNFHVPLLEEAQSYAKHKIVNNQIHYALYARAFEENGTIEYCQKNDIIVTAYRPLGKGKLTQKGNSRIDALAVKYGKTPAQIALNWLVQKPNVVAIFKSSNADHIRENLGAIGWQLSEEDTKELDAKYPRGETMYVPTS
jgi:diketogulonate reductase-like aldo/keto reductase